MPAWKAVDGEHSTGDPETGRAIEPYSTTPNLEARANIDKVVSAVEMQSAVLIDARTTDEYAEGHIPGAVNVPFIDNAEPDSGGHWKSPVALREMYTAIGATTDRAIIPYCTTGVRSAATYFTLKALGYPDVSLYSGSYAEWTSDPDRPIETGTD